MVRRGREDGRGAGAGDEDQAVKVKSSAKGKSASGPGTPGYAPPSLDKYVVEEVHRSQLVDAPYNPRVLNDRAKRKLLAGIKKVGMLGPAAIWNSRTGHIVGGHQRIHILDQINGTQDYMVKVAMVDLDPVREKEANLLLNNPEAQGEWDLEKLEALLHDTTNIDLDATGFDVADVYQLIGDAPMNSSQLDELASKLRTAQQSYTDAVQSTGKRDGIDYYLVVVFRDDDDRTDFLKALHLPDNRFQDGRELRRLLELRTGTDAVDADAVTAADAD